MVTEGVFGMAGDQGKLKEIAEYKEQYGFRLFVDDAHGFGTVGENGRGAGDEQGCHEAIDVYFGTFAKAMATIGAFVAGPKDVIDFLRYNMRSQTFAKSLPIVWQLCRQRLRVDVYSMWGPGLAISSMRQRGSSPSVGPSSGVPMRSRLCRAREPSVGELWRRLSYRIPISMS